MPWKNIMEEENHLLKDDFFFYLHIGMCMQAHAHVPTHTQRREREQVNLIFQLRTKMESNRG